MICSLVSQARKESAYGLVDTRAHPGRIIERTGCYNWESATGKDPQDTGSSGRLYDACSGDSLGSFRSDADGKPPQKV